MRFVVVTCLCCSQMTKASPKFRMTTMDPANNATAFKSCCKEIQPRSAPRIRRSKTTPACAILTTLAWYLTGSLYSRFSHDFKSCLRSGLPAICLRGGIALTNSCRERCTCRKTFGIGGVALLRSWFVRFAFLLCLPLRDKQ